MLICSSTAAFGDPTLLRRKGSYSRAAFVSDFAQDSDIVVSSEQQVNNQNDIQALDSMLNI